MPDVVAVRFVVHGHVQGVFFRDSTRREARRLGLAGWVRNTAAGTVEALAQGEPAAIDELAGFLTRGPEHAIVTGMERFDATLDPHLRGFSIRH